MAMFDDDGEFLPSYDWRDYGQSDAASHGFGSPFGDAQPPREPIQGEQSEPNESWTWRCWLATLWRVRGRDQCGFVASVVPLTSTRPTLLLRR